MTADLILRIVWAFVAAWLIYWALTVTWRDPMALREVVSLGFMILVALLWPLILAWVVFIIAWEGVALALYWARKGLR